MIYQVNHFLIVGYLSLLVFKSSIQLPSTVNWNDVLSPSKAKGSMFDGVAPLLASPFEKSNGKVYTEIPLRLVLKSVSIDVLVKTSPIKDGSWEVFSDVAGYGEGSSYLDEPNGNTVIFAHAKNKLFKNLGKVNIGDVIVVFGNSNVYSYEIVERSKISPYNIEVLVPEKGRNLTLFTCSGYNDEYRLLLKGKLIKVNQYEQGEVI